MTPMTGGELNQLLRVDHQSGTFVLRISRPERTEQAVVFEHRVLRTLGSAGIPVATPVHADDGATAPAWLGSLLTLFPFVPGQHADADSAAHRRLAADVLARIHRESRRLLGDARRPDEAGLADKRWWAWPAIRGLVAANRASLDADVDEITKILDDEVAELDARVSALPSDHPKAVIHGDFNARNVLVDGDSTVHIVDWDDCRFDFVEWELAQAAGHFGGVDVELIRQFLDSYEEAGGLTTPSTREVLPLFMRCGSVNEVFWVLDHAPDGRATLHADADRMLREVAAAAQFFRQFQLDGV